MRFECARTNEAQTVDVCSRLSTNVANADALLVLVDSISFVERKHQIHIQFISINCQNMQLNGKRENVNTLTLALETKSKLLFGISCQCAALGTARRSR